MQKDEATKLWLELKKIHKKLILQKYSAMGNPVEAPIKRAERAVNAALELLEPIVEGRQNATMGKR